jgi:hypothetical protein
MSKKEKIKNWCKNHKDALKTGVRIAGVVAYCVVGYKVGYEVCKNDFNRGLAVVVARNPEIKTMIEKASEEVIETWK